MATKASTVDNSKDHHTKVTWEELNSGDTGSPIDQDGMRSNRALAGCIQFTGTFNGGTTAVLEGSNDGTNYSTLRDMVGANISLTAAGMVEFSTSALYIRPSVSGGSSDDVDAIMVLRG